MLQSLISKRLKLFNPFRDGIVDTDLSLPNPIHLSLGNFAKGEKSEIGVRQASIPSKLMRLVSGDTSAIGFPEIPIPFNFINPVKGDKSVIAFSSSPNQSTLVKSASGDTSVILLPSQLDVI